MAMMLVLIPGTNTESGLINISLDPDIDSEVINRHTINNDDYHYLLLYKVLSFLVS